MDLRQTKGDSQTMVNYMLSYYDSIYTNLEGQIYNTPRLVYLTTLMLGMTNGGMRYDVEDLTAVYNRLNDLLNVFKEIATVPRDIIGASIPVIDRFLVLYGIEGLPINLNLRNNYERLRGNYYRPEIIQVIIPQSSQIRIPSPRIVPSGLLSRENYIYSVLEEFKLPELKSLLRINDIRIQSKALKDEIIHVLIPYFDSLRYPMTLKQPLSYQDYVAENYKMK